MQKTHEELTRTAIMKQFQNCRADLKMSTNARHVFRELMRLSHRLPEATRAQSLQQARRHAPQFAMCHGSRVTLLARVPGARPIPREP
jgi:hypothetical protein